MPSALAALQNATATFTLPAAGTTTDSYGNVVPNTTTLAVGLYLKQGTIQERDLEGSGVNVGVDALEGTAVNPQILDSRIKPGVRGTVVFSTDASQPFMVAQCRFPYGTTGLLGSTLQSVLGDKIRLIRYAQQ